MIGQTLNIKIKLLNQQIILKSVHLIYEFCLQSKQKFHEKKKLANFSSSLYIMACVVGYIYVVAYMLI